MLDYGVVECLQDARFKKDHINYNDWGYSMLFELHNSQLDALGRYKSILWDWTQGLTVSLNTLVGLEKI